MITAFRTPKAFRGLSSDPFSSGTTRCELGQQTFIYGRNGSGKTSLAEILRGWVNGALEVNYLEIDQIAGGRLQSSRVGNGDWPHQVLVYNRYYISENLAPFLDGTDAAKGLVYLGSETVTARRAIDSLEVRVRTISSRRKAVAAAQSEAKRNVEDILRTVQSRIISDLAPGDPQTYSTQAFHIGHVRRLIKSAANVSGADAHEDNVRLAQESSSSAIEEIEDPILDADLRPTELSRSVLSPIPEQTVIEALEGDVRTSQWVENGMALHDVHDKCKFCDDGSFSESRSAALSGHYSEDFSRSRQLAGRAESRLKRYMSKLQASANTVDDLKRAPWLLPNAEWGPVVDELLEQHYAALEATDRGIGKLASKQADPLTRFGWTDSTNDVVVKFDDMNALIEKHNTAHRSFHESKSGAQERVQSHHVASHAAELDDCRVRENRLGTYDHLLESVQDRLETTIADLRASMNDTAHMAKQIDRDVRYVFGHHNLSVSTSPDGKGYVVLRAGTPATHLSEGERNAIAYSYFLTSLNAAGVERDNALVVIDDPVTSMDKDALFAGHALTQERLSGFAQSIILTHDFDYFRLLLRVPTPDRIRAVSATPGAKEDEKDLIFPRQSYLEMDHSTSASAAHLARLPLAQRSGLSEYHYLFRLVATVVLRSQDREDLLLYGNAARRLLESFVAFRAPERSDFKQRVDVVADTCGNVIEPHVRTRVVKFLHAGSHREDPAPDNSLDFTNVHAELCILLDFMAMADPGHFSGMCRATEVPEDALVDSISRGGR
ncbi:AAA family ATPase [Brachybacterium sp. GCM10030268]|uniref:AAA family ATPase n=1 Tax=Brachybacterium sp. GCM10030268 TaxID=3273382 RepID=UPI0036162729